MKDKKTLYKEKIRLICIRLDLILDLWLSSLWGDGKRSYPHPRSGWWLRGATPCPRSGVAVERSNPTSKKLQLRGHRRGREELLHIQGQEGQPSPR